mmetsp:Transcript_7831/g.18110  ORF Transcript_7831/g.18110 Transcript_7831/m.18110 type:complete len:186 (+) Transcript_7831:406-963(+)
MRVQEDAGLGDPEKVVRQGLQLISWKPAGGRLHVTPFLGGRKELMNASLPIMFTFGGKPTIPTEGGMEPEVPDAPDYGQYLREEDTPKPPIILPVKRFDFVIHRRSGGGHHPMSEDVSPPEVKLQRQLGEIHRADELNNNLPGATAASFSQAWPTVLADLKRHPASRQLRRRERSCTSSTFLTCP